MDRSTPRWMAVGALLGASLGCVSGSVFQCEQAEDCHDHGTNGVCQPDGYCSFPDDTCPSGQRYGDLAGGSLAGQCVPTAGGTEDTGPLPGTDDSGDDEPGTSTIALDDGTTTDEAGPTDSSGEPPACGGLGEPCCDGSCAEGVCAPPGCVPCTAWVEADEHEGCAIRSDGELWCWGEDEAGQVGDGPPLDPLGVWQPAPVLEGVIWADIGAFHACALAELPYCWGRNEDGQLGLGMEGPDLPMPAPLDLPEPLLAIEAGGFHTCGLGDSGMVYCWGRNVDDQLGIPGPEGSAWPEPVPDLPSMVALDTGGFHTCAIDEGSQAWCWGRNDFGQLGREDDTTGPAPVLGLPPVRALALGDYHGCALDMGGEVWCWGRNNLSQTGQVASMEPVWVPVVVEGLPPVDGLSSGDDHVCAWIDGGEAWCWGNDGAGQLGLPGGGSMASPVEMPFTAVSVVGAGRAHTCATEGDGRIVCLGDNAFGQLGDGTTQDAPRPVSVAGPCPG